MKNKLIPMLILAITSAAGLTAHAETVNSANAVGMVKVTVPVGTLRMLSIPFEVDEPVNVTDLFGLSLPYGTTVFVWDSSSQGWNSEVFQQGFLGQSDRWSPGTTVYNRTMGLFIQIPNDQSNDDYDIVFSGEVPGASNAPTTELNFQSGFFYLVGFHYPVEVEINSVNFGLTPNYGDTVHIWDPTLSGGVGGYTSAVYQQGFLGQQDRWSENVVFSPGQGFFYESRGDNTWTTNSSDFYQWP